MVSGSRLSPTAPEACRQVTPASAATSVKRPGVGSADEGDETPTDDATPSDDVVNPFLEEQRALMRLEEFQPRVLTSFVRNRLIDSVAAEDSSFSTGVAGFIARSGIESEIRIDNFPLN